MSLGLNYLIIKPEIIPAMTMKLLSPLSDRHKESFIPTIKENIPS